MKIKYILIVVLFISCAQKKKEIKEPEKQTQEVVEVLLDSLKGDTNLSFDNVISSIKSKSVPLIDDTNFDSFIEEEDYKMVAVKTLKLEKIYPNFYKEDYNYRAIYNYKLPLSSRFHTVVVTVLKGEHEMESTLINYKPNGELIGFKVISYDEIAEGMSKIESKIEQHKITINNIVSLEENVVTTELFNIEANGKIKPVPQKETLINSVLKQLNLENSKVNTELLVTKVMPDNPYETIIVIPEIVDEGEQYFELNSHIVLVDNTTGKITHKYFESSKTNGWESDAIQLREISIDTAPYNLTETVRAFGVKVRYVGSSQVNPYENERISLFVKSDDSLKKLLYNFDVMNNSGALDTDCVGEFKDVKNTLIISEEKTHKHFDILVKSKITKNKSYVDENGDCDSQEQITSEEIILKFNGEEYKKDKNR